MGGGKEKKKEKMEESQKTGLSAWDRRVVEADSVALHPWETGRDMTKGMVGYVCASACAQKRRNIAEKRRQIYGERGTAHNVMETVIKEEPPGGAIFKL